MVAYALAVGAAVGVVALAALVFRKIGKGSDDNDPGGPSVAHAGAMLSALFLLAFAIAIIVPWTKADSARQNTQTESQAAVEAYWAAAGLPDATRDAVRSGLRDYVGFVVDSEWPLMAQGAVDPVGAERVDALRTQVTGLATKSDDVADAQDQVLAHVQDLAAARAQRVIDAGATPPNGLLLLTALSGIIVVLFPLLAGARPRGWSVLPLMALAAMLGFGIYLTWDIMRVFDGPLAVGPDAFRAALQEFARISGGV
ncbi:bestrophin-like domain [Nonomuraea endophytica]|uniref:DUF4239 domain-containing protein n=1 Tax=Nonomuraea endophytica TaxID=714136 RepID=A0A7W8EGM9_9ACTN|nr:DUF4239 domain-containing protein [Nonomuraea endophytica]MBB5078566.1 hypothetical protein [Nonomuraea endophytica]